MININKLSVKQVRKIHKEKDEFDIETPKGYIYLAGSTKYGILSKLDDGKHYVSIKGRWIKIN